MMSTNKEFYGNKSKSKFTVHSRALKSFKRNNYQSMLARVIFISPWNIKQLYLLQSSPSCFVRLNSGCILVPIHYSQNFTCNTNKANLLYKYTHGHMIEDILQSSYSNFPKEVAAFKLNVHFYTLLHSTCSECLHHS